MLFLEVWYLLCLCPRRQEAAVLWPQKKTSQNTLETHCWCHGMCVTADRREQVKLLRLYGYHNFLLHTKHSKQTGAESLQEESWALKVEQKDRNQSVFFIFPFTTTENVSLKLLKGIKPIKLHKSHRMRVKRLDLKRPRWFKKWLNVTKVSWLWLKKDICLTNFRLLQYRLPHFLNYGFKLELKTYV